MSTEPPDTTDANDANDATASGERDLAPAWLLATLFTLLSGLILIPGFADYGLGSATELPIFDHARALMGETVAEVERIPWLPSWTRAWAIALFDSMAALRLPGAVAVSGIVGLTVWIARARGASTQIALLAGAFALSFPGMIQQARAAVGNPVGELFSTLAIAAGVFAVGPRDAVQKLVGGLVGLAALVLATLSAGIVLGALIPIVALALLSGDDGHSRRSRHNLSIGLWGAAAVIAALAGYLAVNQGDGYIPILGASRHTEIIARPSSRLFHQIVEDFGYQIFPWLPLAVLGALGRGRDRWPALWLLVGFIITGIWTLAYGRVAVPIAAPAGLCCGALIGHFTSRQSSRALRRFVLLVGLAGFLIMAKDADRTPSRVGMPITERRGEHNYPAAETGAEHQLSRQAKLAGLALLAAFIVAPAPRSPSPSPSSTSPRAWRRRLDSVVERVPDTVRDWAPAAIMLVTLGLQSLGYVQLLDRTMLHESPMRPLRTHAELAATGALPETLALGQVRDRGVELYGPPEDLRPFLRGRSELTNWLSSEQPIAALIRATDLPFATQQHRMHGWPLYVLDHSNRNLVLVSNQLPAGLEDQNKLYEVLRDEPPALPGGHETRVQFEGLVDVVAWRISEPVVRGREFELELVLAAHNKLPGTAEIYARLLQGRVSRINPLPQKIADDRYPPKYWREGDFILHRVTIKAPTLEVMPGEHKLVVGLRRTKTKNFSITIPTGKTGEHGVEIIDKRRNFASLGTVTVY